VLFEGNNGRIPYTLPEGTVISVENPDVVGLVEIVWNKKRLLMFTRDLRSRAEKIESHPESS